jgi:hypothetical protein
VVGVLARGWRWQVRHYANAFQPPARFPF